MRAWSSVIGPMVVMSPPAQKAPPAPVSTITRTPWSPMAVSMASASRTRSGMSTALRRSGRFSVITRTGPSSRTSTMGPAPLSAGWAVIGR